MMLSKDIPMDPVYRRKTRQIRKLELGCLSLAGFSFVSLVAILVAKL